jgi:hypothetical protein
VEILTASLWLSFVALSYFLINFTYNQSVLRTLEKSKSNISLLCYICFVSIKYRFERKRKFSGQGNGIALIWDSYLWFKRKTFIFHSINVSLHQNTNGAVNEIDIANIWKTALHNLKLNSSFDKYLIGGQLWDLCFNVITHLSKKIFKFMGLRNRFCAKLYIFIFEKKHVTLRSAHLDDGGTSLSWNLIQRSSTKNSTKMCPYNFYLIIVQRKLFQPTF